MNTDKNAQEPIKHSILVVDDTPKNIQLVANYLTKEGYQVNFALDGKMAIEHATKEAFDLILLDIMMPGMGGFEVCEILKSNPDTASIPVIFLTAKTDDESVTKGFEVGGVDYIYKPFNLAELLARVRTHIHLREREVQLQNLNQTKDKLLSIIGHDLKTPLSNMIALSEIVVRDYKTFSEEELADILNDIKLSGSQGIWLLENLLSWTRVQTGKMSFAPIGINVKNIFDNNTALILPNAQTKGIELVSSCPEDLKITADINITDTIIRNLLSNAMKFTEPGGKITLNAKQYSDHVCICVVDSGIGISEERLAQLFKGAVQESTSGTLNEKGSGLGLILVKELTEKQGATLEVSSKVGEGSVFTVKFPSEKYSVSS